MCPRLSLWHAKVRAGAAAGAQAGRGGCENEIIGGQGDLALTLASLSRENKKTARAPPPPQELLTFQCARPCPPPPGAWPRMAWPAPRRAQRSRASPRGRAALTLAPPSAPFPLRPRPPRPLPRGAGRRPRPWTAYASGWRTVSLMGEKARRARDEAERCDETKRTRARRGLSPSLTIVSLSAPHPHHTGPDFGDFVKQRGPDYSVRAPNWKVRFVGVWRRDSGGERAKKKASALQRTPSDVALNHDRTLSFPHPLPFPSLPLPHSGKGAQARLA